MLKLAKNTANFGRVGRNGAMENTYNAMAERINKREEKPEFKSNRESNPIIATVATTGGGKSRHLDEVGALLHDDLHMLCKDPRLRKILLDSVAVSVTFNGGSSLTIGEKEGKIHPYISIASRALYRY